MKKITPEIQHAFFEQMWEEEYKGCGRVRRIWEKFVYTVLTIHTHEEMILDATLAECLPYEPCKYAFVERGEVYNCQCGKCF